MAFNSPSSFCALSQSKTPPQQFDRLLDFTDKRFHFRAHGNVSCTDAPARDQQAPSAGPVFVFIVAELVKAVEVFFFLFAARGGAQEIDIEVLEAVGARHIITFERFKDDI